jgi:hypothetical protein
VNLKTKATLPVDDVQYQETIEITEEVIDVKVGGVVLSTKTIALT